MKRARVVAFGCVAVAAAAVFAADPPKVPFSLAKETTVITGPLKADGAPDYIAALNERYGKGVTPVNNGFVAWLQVTGTVGVFDAKMQDRILELLGTKPIPADDDLLKVFSTALTDQGRAPAEVIALDEDFDSLRKTLWKAADHPAAAAFLKQQELALNRLVFASERPRWWVPAVSQDGTVLAVLLPSLGQIRNAANILAARATQRAAAGDFEGFRTDVIAIKRLARLVAAGPTTIERLVAVAVDALANYPVGAAVGAGAFSEDQCKTLDDELQALPPIGDIAETIDVMERWTMLEMVQSIAMGQGRKILNPANDPQNGRTIAWIASIDPASVDWDVVLRHENKAFDRVVRGMKEPSLKRMQTNGEDFEKEVTAGGEAAAAKEAKQLPGETREQFSARVGEAILSVYLPGLTRAEELRRRTVLQNQMAHLLLLAAQVKARTGNWPATLQELKPAMIAEIPKDMYPAENPGELHYKLMAAGPCIWSAMDNGRIYVGAEPPPKPVAPADAAKGGLP